MQEQEGCDKMRLYDKMNGGIYVIAEMSANHAGKIENAYRIIEEAAKAGADCVKIQTYTADTLTINCSDEPYKIKGDCGTDIAIISYIKKHLLRGNGSGS